MTMSVPSLLCNAVQSGTSSHTWRNFTRLHGVTFQKTAMVLLLNIIALMCFKRRSLKLCIPHSFQVWNLDFHSVWYICSGVTTKEHVRGKPCEV
jgi:hypothetical protein